ncbi:hypothetical protein PC129_g684 [Phytophthora cactorum]|uniref:Uncharacterized protein n=1 Tax=Phytophthora cactorum TaxID=29920 RepID=A0A8T1LEX5_9STRA|nr:hypothetical protein Pcac1_g2031 [Phytophthora cactorum]KAG3113503.1 hypothetical protein PI125_g7269 [Phytophthora idaei]KAG2845779.1 hypothetical protein PC111_g1425 [Phytophthora cactorum]KAG2867163.1 hypothetical protein PC113_g2229 [Phytophthora cactorum]KAG2930982.1 hypothetical protein PC114_g2338 [Phytophthora cactorum]
MGVLRNDVIEENVKGYIVGHLAQENLRARWLGSRGMECGLDSCGPETPFHLSV